MVWHDKQNAVVLDRSISLEIPIAPQRIGRKNRTRKAIIFPPRVAVMPGRATRTPISAALNRTRMTIKVVPEGIDYALLLIMLSGTYPAVCCQCYFFVSDLM